MARRGRRERTVNGSTAQRRPTAEQPVFTLPPYDLVDEERLQQIHDKSMQILEEGGIAFYYDEAQAILRAHGVDVGSDGVARFDRNLVMEYVAKAPSEFVWSGRNPQYDVHMGGNHVVFAPVAGPPFVRDLDRGRRDGSLEDLINFIKLSQTTPYLHTLGAEIAVPADVPIRHRHLDTMHALLTYGDKPVMGIYHTGPIALDALSMAEIMHGKSAMDSKHILHCVVNVSSPRRLDDRMLGVLIAYARRNQVVDVTPFILSGAMGPVSILGTVAQLNAEVLAGIVLTQMVNPGTPSVYGSFQAVIDMQSGAPVFGAPESQLALYLSGQLARKYNLPFRAAGAYASSKISDAQAGYESVMAMLPSMFVRPNFILHAAGWLEGGLTAGYEKFVLDCELLGMYHTYLKNVRWDDDEWALDSIIREVPPGGHHLGTAHTMRHFRTAFYRAELFDYDSAETWEANGGFDSVQRANKKWKQMLRDYEKPPLDPSVDEALRDFMERRKREGFIEV